MKLLKRLLGVDELGRELDTLVADRDSARQESANLRERNNDLNVEVAKLKSEVYTLSADLNSLRNELREKTDADLLLVSVRIAMTVLRGESPKPEDLQLQNMLNAQRQQMMGAYNNPLSAYGHLGGLSSLSAALGIR